MNGTIVAIRKVECKDEFVYNLEVEADNDKDKNYFADGVLVSNCHRMSATASDALLKLLEEPPAKTRFVLCTTDVGKMRPAIVSRCQKHEFTKIFWMQMAECLTNVAKEEGISIETGAINICARAAKGSMRSALNYLQKLATRPATEHITVAMAEEEFGSLPEAKIFDLIDELLKHEGSMDATQAFRIINELLVGGTEFNTIADCIISHLDNMVVGLTSQKAAEFVYLTDEGKVRLIKQLKYCKEHEKLKAVLGSMDKMSASRQWSGFNANPESALRKWFIESLHLFRQKGGS